MVSEYPRASSPYSLEIKISTYIDSQQIHNRHASFPKSVYLDRVRLLSFGFVSPHNDAGLV